MMPYILLSSNFQTHSLTPNSNRAGSGPHLPRRVPPRDQRASNNKPSSGRGGFSFWPFFFRRVIPFCIALGLAGAILLVAAFAWYSRDLPDPNKLIDRAVAQSTKIYDRTGTHLLYEIHGEQRRTLVQLNDIPKFAIQATIAVEDKTFYEHQGFSIPRIIKSLLVDIITGSKAQGGSTLTQQLVKNAILTNEKFYSRKIKELVLSYRIEQKFTKDEILKLYFNEIPYGSTAYGIESASGIYFGKSVKDLTLGEAAILAALPKAPSYYSPYGPHRDELISRQKLVLRLMREQGYISTQQEAQANQEQVVFKTKREDITAPHFVFMVKSELADKYGDRLVEQGGLKITTTLDWDKQQLAEQTVDEIAPQLKDKYGASNAALVTIDVASGDVLVMIGSKDYFDDSIDGQVNVATSLRQPGSSLKPFVYAEAFTKGYNPNTMLMDVQTSFAASGPQYSPKNYDGKEHGPVSMRQALAGSLNIPAVKTLYLAGVQNVITRLQSLGYTSLVDPNRYGLSLVLGGGEVKLLEHTNGYASLAREGVYQKYYTVLKVEDNQGKILEEKETPEQKRVLDKQVVREVTDILSDNEARSFIFGASNYLTLAGRPVAAKTGTTNDYKDSWLLGYTPQLVTGVWVGNNDNTPMNRASGANAAGPIWQKYMNKILAAYPPQGFTKPDPTTCTKIMVCGQLSKDTTVRMDKVTGQPATPFTPPENVEEKTYKELHTILHYVDKDNPLDVAYREHPENDSQYNLWEVPVRRWAAANGYVSETPGSGNDQFKTPEYQPSISWVSPGNGATITDPNLSLQVEASAKRGISKVDYYFDNQYIGTISSQPYILKVPAQSEWRNSQYQLRAVAYDDVGNSKDASISVTLNLPKTNLDFKVLWLTPAPSQNYTVNNAPKNLSLTLDMIDKVKKVDFYLVVDNQTSFLGVIENPKDKTLSLPTSRLSQPGVYKLYVAITDIFNRLTTSDEIAVAVK